MKHFWYSTSKKGTYAHAAAATHYTLKANYKGDYETDVNLWFYGGVV